MLNSLSKSLELSLPSDEGINTYLSESIRCPILNFLQCKKLHNVRVHARNNISCKHVGLVLCYGLMNIPEGGLEIPLAEQEKHKKLPRNKNIGVIDVVFYLHRPRTPVTSPHAVPRLRSGRHKTQE
jgi:hypothetical protein